MSLELSAPNRRRSFFVSALASAFALVFSASASFAQAVSPADAAVDAPSQTSGATEDTTIRPFHAHIPEAQLTDLKKRILATR